MPKNNSFSVLAIDTSCDDTAVAIIDQNFTVLSNVVSSQIALHQPYGGVFPTVAKLAHQENIGWCVKLALKRAHLDWSQIQALAVTTGPGLAPALEVGLRTTQELAHNYCLPIIPVNHVEAHAWSSQLRTKSRLPAHSIKEKDQPSFPILSIVLSGGHSEFILITSPGKYQILGQTLDDAAGECLDKIGRLLNLGYPAGPLIEKLALSGDPLAYRFPLPLTTRPDFDLSFSGLKTFARNLVQELNNSHAPQPLSAQTIHDLAASAQQGVFKHILYKLKKLLMHLHSHQPELFPTEVWLGGGVAANIAFRRQLRNLLTQPDLNFSLHLAAPLKKYCGDNAAMIGLIAILKYPLATTTHPQLFTSPENLDRQPGLTITSWL